jgi:shikimate dehydrogenase
MVTRSFKSELTCLFGQPVAENPTQVMIEAAYRALGLDWRYLTIEVAPADLADAVRGMRAMGFRGGNCTLPHKVAVVPLLDELSPAARAIGAVNCIVRRGDRLVGENTDGKGFLQSVQEVTPVAGKSAVLLGAGGAARAVAVELLGAGLGRLTVVSRGAERGAALAADLQRLAPGRTELAPWRGDFAVPAGTDLLINATSVGLFPDVGARVPVDEAALRPPLLVCDLIPNPPRTRLIRTAEAAGCATLDGLGMLVYQGVLGVRLWTGRDPDPGVMRRALEDAFAAPA